MTKTDRNNLVTVLVGCAVINILGLVFGLCIGKVILAIAQALQ